MTTLLKTENLTKHFDLGKGRQVHAVDGLSLAIEEREIVGLVGESGSGKSTFGKTILGLHERTAGRVSFQDEDLPARYRQQDFRRYAPHMQMIFQDPYSSLNPRMTVGEIVGEGLKLHSDLSSREVRERSAEWLRRVGLEPAHMSRYPHEFSGGQRQRIGIARALILEPEFVVCDEPISALDVSLQAQVINLLDDLKASLGLTLLFAALTCVLFSLAGLINGVYAKSFDDIAIIPTFVLTPLTYLGGIFYSLEMLPPFWQQVSLFNPILHMIGLFRYGWMGLREVEPGPSLLLLAALTAALALFCLHLLRRGTGVRS